MKRTSLHIMLAIGLAISLATLGQTEPPRLELLPAESASLFSTVAWDDDDPDRDLTDAPLDDFNDPNEDEMIPQIVSELFLGTMVYPQEKGELQITTGYFPVNEILNDGPFPCKVEYGITDRFQVCMELPLEVHSPKDQDVTTERDKEATMIGCFGLTTMTFGGDND